MSNVPYILYPALTQPVLPANLQPETTTESRWHYPWSEPVRFRIDPRMAVVLAAASGVIAPFPSGSVTPGALFWFSPFSEPVRVPRRLPEPEQSFYASILKPIVSFSWYDSLSEPVRVRPDIGASRQQAFFFTEAFFGEIILYANWGYPWTDPIWLDERGSRLKAHLQSTTTVDPDFGIYPPLNRGYIIC